MTSYSRSPPEPLGNQAPSNVLLSDKEAAVLALHFERLIESRDFLEALYFVDQLYGQSEPDLHALKSIFVAATKRKGRAISIQSTMKWQQFLVRLGVERPTWPNQNVRPMSFDRFLRMEQRLFEHLKLQPRTRQIMMHVVSQGRDSHESLRKFDFSQMHGERLDRPFKPEDSLFRRVRERARSIFADTLRRDVSAQQLAGLGTILANSAVMFTTRDWGVAGTMSTMSGAVPLTLIR